MVGDSIALWFVSAALLPVLLWTCHAVASPSFGDQFHVGLTAAYIGKQGLA
jgi:hypothetical protein